MKAPRRHQRMWRSGVTLVELLVSVAVVAVCLGMLLAVVGRALKNSQTVKCTTHLRQLGLGINRFVADHNGTLPPSTEGQHYPGPVFGKNVPEWGATWGEYLVATYFDGDKTPLRCPSRPASFIAGSGYYIDYGYNQRLCPSENGYAKGLKLASLSRPSQTILLADSASYANGVARSGFYRILDANDLHPRHLGSTVNTLYVDQHIERHRLDLTNPPGLTAPLGREQFVPQ